MHMHDRAGSRHGASPAARGAMRVSRPRRHARPGTRRERCIRAIESYREHQLHQALALLDREGSPLANVRSMLRLLETQASDAPVRDCPVAGALAGPCLHDPEVAKLLRETLELLREGLERSLRDARARGELTEDKSPRRVSHALANAVLGRVVTGYAGSLSMLD